MDHDSKSTKMEVEEDDSVDYDLLDEDEQKQEEERLIEERRKRRQAILDKYNKSSPGFTSNVSTPTAQSKYLREREMWCYEECIEGWRWTCL